MSKQQRQTPDSGRRILWSKRIWLAYSRDDLDALAEVFPKDGTKANLQLVPAPVADPEVEAYAKRFQAAWHRSVTAIIEAGQVLIEAKQTLGHGRFGAMVRDRLSLGIRTAQRLMAIANDPRITTHVSHLPSSWPALYEVTRLPDPEFHRMLAAGEIHPAVQRKEIVAARKASQRAEHTKKLIRLSNIDAPLPTDRRYSVAYADPAWKFDAMMTMVPEEHYPTMSTDDICRMPVADLLTPDAVLFLWVPSALLKKGLLVMESWGVEYVTHMVWVKDRVGMGRVVLQQHELLLIGRRGRKIDIDPYNRPPSVVRAPRGKHSAKPEQFYEIIERMYPGLPKIELFARNRREGWDAWGNEVI